MIFSGRNLVKYPYSCYGYTRGGGKTWHDGIDVFGMDDDKIRMPGYNGKSIAGTVVTARIVTNKSNKTWEWGYYVCVKLDANQTPDAVNYLYFCHCSKLLASVGQKVKTGDVLAVVGQTGNAAGTWTHCHFEVRATATSKGLDPTAYAGINRGRLYMRRWFWQDLNCMICRLQTMSGAVICDDVVGSATRCQTAARIVTQWRSLQKTTRTAHIFWQWLRMLCACKMGTGWIHGTAAMKCRCTTGRKDD